MPPGPAVRAQANRRPYSASTSPSFNGKPEASVSRAVYHDENTDAFGLPLNEDA
jgi:hypothetical protein